MQRAAGSFNRNRKGVKEVVFGDLITCLLLFFPILCIIKITVSVNCLHRQSKYPCIKVPEGLMAFGHFFALGQIVARAKLNIGLFGNNTHGWLIRRPCVILYIPHGQCAK